ncbi:MAG: LamG domain-containing protein [Patescibacteria group bacterium]
MTLEAWVKLNSYTTSDLIVGKGAEYWLAYNYQTGVNCTTTNRFSFMTYDGDYQCAYSGFQPELNKWYHVVGIYNGSNLYIYIDGQLSGGPVAQGAIISNSYNFDIGSYSLSPYTAVYAFNGSIDEVRLSNTARSAEEIRQVYEIGKRTHVVTIDFGASLDSGNLITGSGDTSFTVDATTHGLSQKGSNLFIGDKIIIRENYDGTEYMAQGTVTSVNQSTGAVTVASWDAGGTFPTGGYTVNADIFKWQREYFDIAGAMSSHVNAIDELSFQFLDGNAGRTFWIDDIGMIQTDGYLTDNLGATIGSTPQQYIQYRALLSTTDPDPTPALGPITLDYTEGDLTMTAGSTSQSYMNTNNNTAFNVQCNGVTYAPSGDTVTCYGSWNQTNWFAINTDTSPLSDVTIQDDEDVSGWTDYPLGNGTVTLYVRAGVDINYTDAFSFNVEKDMSRPAVTAITSVAGDTTSPYYDTTNDSSTLVVYTADADAATCKWDETDLTYGAMANTCTSTTNCTLNLAGEGAQTVYMRCVDTAGNYADTSYQLDYNIDATPPSVSSITSVAGDALVPYKDNTDNGSTAVVYTASADATACKWDESDVAYGSMANTCTDTANCTLSLTGEGAQTIYMRCIDSAGLTSTSSYQLDYNIDTTAPVINSVTSVAGDSSSPYYDITDNNDTQILFDVSGDATSCKWDTSDVAYDSMANTCGAAGDCTTNLSGDGAKTVYIRCKDDIDNKATSSTQVDYTIDTTPPSVSSITSVAGDASVPYKDNTDNGSTAVVYVASGDAVSCKWDESDVAYGSMANTCTDTANCTLNLTGEGAQTVYMRCIDAAGLTSTSSYQLDYNIDTTAPVINSITSVAGDASSPYYDITDNSATQILFDVSADATECKWDTSDVAYDSMANTCGAAGDCTTNLPGDGAKTVYIRCKDDIDNKATSSTQVNYTVDSTPPAVTSITSVAGDASASYNDGTDNSSTAIVYTASADATACKWDESDVAYGSMANSCTDTANCTLNLTGEGAQTVYMRCIDAAGLTSTSSYQLDYNIDTTPPSISSITSVAGDASAPYKDGTDDGNTLAIFSADADATECKWDTSDVAYDTMANTCTSTANCTYNLSGDGAKTVFMRCRDEVGNKATSSYQVDYTIDSTAPVINSITSVAGDTTSPYYDTTDNSATQILFDVTDAAECKWNTTDVAYDSMVNTCGAVGDCTTTLSGQGAKTIYIRCKDEVDNKMTSSQTVNYTIDSIAPSVTSVSSVAGDPEAPYLDVDADGLSLIIYAASADAATCKWNNLDVAYDSMSGTCESTTNCSVTHSSDGAKSVFMRCADAAGNKSTNSYQVDFDVDEQIGGGGTTTLLETSAPGASGVILVTLTPDMTTPAVNGSVKIRFSSEYDLSGLTEDDVSASCGDVTFANNEIIYKDGVKINKADWNWWNIFKKVLAAGENSIVFPFTGSLDNSDGQCSFTINNANNPTGVGPQSVVYNIFSSNNGTGTPLEEGDGVVHINYLVIVTAEIESQLTFTIDPVGTGQLVNGETTDISTTSDDIDFGIFTTGDDRIGAHDLVVSTNATDGYVTTIEFDQSLASGLAYIPDFPATNANPGPWITPPGSGTNGYFGYTTNDDSLLTAMIDRFVGNKWAGFDTSPQEIAYDPNPVDGQTTRVGYRLQVLNGQELGTYVTTVRYICTPTF